MTSIRRADRKLRSWERYLRRFRETFGDPTIRSQRGHQRAWDVLAAAHRGRGKYRAASVCPCPRPAPPYFCPTSGEVESPCHGGFDVCCDRPDLHRPVTEPGVSLTGIKVVEGGGEHAQP